MVLNEGIVTESGVTLSATNYIGNEIFGRKNASDTVTSFLLSNAHGDIEAVMQGATRVGTYQYDAYGNATVVSEADGFTNPIRYAGEYYDEESGNYYLRARYYNPSLGRFMAEDPIMDGQNWYAYCAGNPVMYVDPSGMEIYLEGTPEEQEAILDQLRMLTDDKLTRDEETGEVIIVTRVDNGEHPVGTELVRAIIDDQDHWCTIEAWESPKGDTKEVRNSGNCTVSFNYSQGESYICDVNGEYVSLETPPYIILGHELVHVDRVFRDAVPKFVSTGIYIGPYIPNVIPLGIEPTEELIATGIRYLDISNNTWYDPASAPYSENALRMENGLPQRVYYNTLEINVVKWEVRK